MTLWKRIKNLWYISGLDLKPSKANKKAKAMVQDLLNTLSGKKMATIVETKDPEELFPNEEENGTSN